MAALVMSLDNMIQNNRCNSVRGVDGGRGMCGVRGPWGTFRGYGRLAGSPRRGPLGMYGPGGTSRGAGRLAGPPRPGRLGMYGVRGTFRGVGRLAGPRRGSLGTYTVSKTMCSTKNSPWQNNVLGDRFKAMESSGVESGTKLQVSNLSDEVSNEDIRELFSEIGELLRYGIHYDKNGSPCGSAEVMFVRRSDAFQAVKKYNDTQFHGKPMKIENLGSIVRAHVASRLNITGGANGRRSVLKTSSSRRARGGVHMHRRGGRGRVHGGQGEMTEKKSAEELDKELETDQAETTRIEELET